MGALEVVNRLNYVDVDKYQILYFNNYAIGQIRIDRLIYFKGYPLLFVQAIDSQSMHFNDLFVNASFETRNRMMMDFCRYLCENGYVQEWRNELYPVFQNSLSRTDPIFLVERGCVGYLGLPAYGVHVNGFVRTQEGFYMWIAKRSMSRHVAPGKLDQIAAGGLPFGLDPYNNVIKECQEEANIPLSLASKAQYIHTLRYHTEDDRGSKPDYIYVFDLELPVDFIPSANDGEAESFSLLPLSDVLDLATNTLQFKPNCGLVVIDFLVRHQCLPNFLALNQLIIRDEL